MPRRRPKELPERAELVRRLIAAIVAANVRHAVLAEDIEHQLRWCAEHNEKLHVEWELDSGDGVILRLHIAGGSHLGLVEIESYVAPSSSDGWMGRDVHDFRAMVEAHADVSALAQRIVACEAGLRPVQEGEVARSSVWDRLLCDQEAP